MIREIKIAEWIKKLNIVYVRLPYYLLILNLFTFPYNFIFRIFTNQPLDVELWVFQFCATLLLVTVYKEIRSLEDEDKTIFLKIKDTWLSSDRGLVSKESLSDKQSKIMHLHDRTFDLQKISFQFSKHKATTFTYSLLVLTSSLVVSLFFLIIIPPILVSYPGLLLAILTPPFFINNITKLVYDGILMSLWLFAICWFILSLLQLIEYRYWDDIIQKAR